MTIHRHGKKNVYGNLITNNMCEACIIDKENNQIKIIIQELNGNKIAYSNQSEFLIQIGKNKSSYKTQYTIKGNLAQAVRYYNGINIGNGYKKRLINHSLNKPLLARQFS